jgi:undecaprenyl-diphosphatase
LATAAFATAGALCVGRIWPGAARPAMAVAVLWVLLVGLSRLVLGVHWPSDVLAAMCLGVFVPLALSVAFDRSALHLDS